MPTCRFSREAGKRIVHLLSLRHHVFNACLTEPFSPQAWEKVVVISPSSPTQQLNQQELVPFKSNSKGGPPFSLRAVDPQPAQVSMTTEGLKMGQTLD